jgi:hypothetical protein
MCEEIYHKMRSLPRRYLMEDQLRSTDSPRYEKTTDTIARAIKCSPTSVYSLEVCDHGTDPSVWIDTFEIAVECPIEFANISISKHAEKIASQIVDEENKWFLLLLSESDIPEIQAKDIKSVIDELKNEEWNLRYLLCNEDQYLRHSKRSDIQTVKYLLPHDFMYMLPAIDQCGVMPIRQDITVLPCHGGREGSLAKESVIVYEEIGMSILYPEQARKVISADV